MIQEFVADIVYGGGPILKVYVKAPLLSEAERIIQAQYPGYQILICCPTGK